MALTPEEVVGKRFQPTKFREGYDQDEVDDFLDEVVNELRRLTSDNDELRQKLTACERRVGELSRAGASTDTQSGPVSPPAEQAAPVLIKAAEPEKPEPVKPEPVKPEPVAAPAAATNPADGADAATGMLALAQRLHDEYVHSGEVRRDELVAQAETHAARLTSEAEERQRQTLGSLEQKRTMLERKIDELRAFERDYRTRMKSYLEGQLRDLDSTQSVSPAPDGAAAGDSGHSG